jgi:hypothetical protein
MFTSCPFSMNKSCETIIASWMSWKSHYSVTINVLIFVVYILYCGNEEDKKYKCHQVALLTSTLMARMENRFHLFDILVFFHGSGRNISRWKEIRNRAQVCTKVMLKIYLMKKWNVASSQEYLPSHSFGREWRCFLVNDAMLTGDG